MSLPQHGFAPNDLPDPAGQNAFLNHLRFVALECRVKARTDMVEACALLATNKAQSFRAHAEALVRCLNQALSKQAIFFRPGTRDVSFDEAWLMQLARALDGAAEDNVQFLLRSRVAPEYHRHMRFLVSRIAERF